MLGFIMIISIAALFGLQLGVYEVLKGKGLIHRRALFFSTIIYLMPLVLIIAHIRLYRERHVLLRDSRDSLKLTQEQFDEIKKGLDSKYYLMISIIGAIIDMVTIKDNLKVLIDFSVQNNKTVLNKKSVGNKSIYQQKGLIGVAGKVFSLVSDDMKNHAKEEKIFKHYAI